ncbi:unnamed protein product [Mesocestoides corti]|uniref:Secreted protein n=1 Tax=Mesocestoides corti TaxID=53468 RepID=A0A0R3UAR9_MESCO|nr:unnamed protein product [Mesocestoides corti]
MTLGLPMTALACTGWMGQVWTSCAHAGTRRVLIGSCMSVTPRACAHTNAVRVPPLAVLIAYAQSSLSSPTSFSIETSSRMCILICSPL